MSSTLDVLKQAARLQQAPESDADPSAANQPPPPALAHLPPHILMLVPRVKLLKQAKIFSCPAWAGMPVDAGAHLQVTRNGAKVGSLNVGKLPFYLFGQGSECDHVVQSPSVSRYHCVIVFSTQQRCFVLLDMSTNGTKVNGQRVEKRKEVSLRYGDVLQFGESPREYKLRKDPALQRLSAAERVSQPSGTSPPPLSPSTPPPPPVAAAADDTADGAHAAEAAAAAAAELEPVVEQRALARHFRQILLKHKDVANPVSKNPARKGEIITRSVEDAKDLAHQLRQIEGIEQEEKFVEICKEFGECNRAKSGGDLGLVEQGDFGDTFDIAAFSLGPGRISMPFTTELGVHLVMRLADSTQ